MSKPIDIPQVPRSKSVPRTSDKQNHHLQVYSDSQLSYDSFPSSADRSPANSLTTITSDSSNKQNTSTAYYNSGSDDNMKSESIVRLKRRKTVHLKRSARVSRSFAASSGVTAFQAGLRRRSADCKNVFSKDLEAGSIPCPSNSVRAALLFAHNTLKLSCPLLPIDIQPPVPAPLVVEDPPSSDNASDLEEDTVKYNLDPVFINGSSGNFGGAGVTQGLGAVGARSAPSTPHGVVSLGSAGVAVAGGCSYSPTNAGEPHSQPCSPSYRETAIPKSPSHVFTKYEKGALKQLSSSAPIMTAQARSPEPPSPKGGKAEKMPAGSSKARQKKFHRHFTQVDDDERVLNYYSCALVGDILLQGHLYITKNYFAFYSNVFGYVTKLLIPITSVLKITKERTARIIPNAVGVASADDKHVFGSLLSRDSTYKLMMMVLKAANSVEPVETLPVPKDIRPGELDASEVSCEDETSSQSGNDSPTLRTVRAGILPPIATKIPPDVLDSTKPSLVTSALKKEGISADKPKSIISYNRFTSLPAYNMFLLLSTLLLLLLFTSAGVLLYRISRIQTKYSMGLQDNMMTPSNEIYNEILHWQSQLHTKSAGAVHNFLDSNLDQIAKVRKSLEALSTLLMPNNPSGSQAQAPEHRSEVPPETNTPTERGTPLAGPPAAPRS